MSGMAREDADDLLAKAIRGHAESVGEPIEGKLLNTYIVVACWQPAEGDPVYNYTLHTDRPTAAPHETKGLLQEGLDTCRINERIEAEGDDG